jgi:hypothetical protein
MTAKHAFLAFLLLLGAAGCGKEVVVGGQKDVDTYATGDGTPEGGASPSLAPALSLAPGGPLTSHIAGRAQGTVSFRAKVALVGAAGGRADVFRTPASALVRIDGHDTTFVAGGRVREDSYVGVRVTFTEVMANVTGGLVIGGVNVTGAVNVAVGDSVVVERQVALGGNDDDVRLLVDLDASAWLSATSPLNRIVPAAAFQNAEKVRTF